MALISIPTGLSAGGISDASHITSFYDQLSNSSTDIRVLGVYCDNFYSSSSLNTTPTNAKIKIITLTRGGNLDGININATMILNGYTANNYQNQIMLVYSTTPSFKTQLIMSRKVSKSLYE